LTAASDTDPVTRFSVGVAGWSYPDWRDTVYRLPAPWTQPDLFGRPSPPPARYAEDDLAYLSGFVDMIEINSTFYRIPTPRTAASWVRRANGGPGFFFTVKLNREFTHEFRRDRSLAETFRTALRPLSDAGLLRGVLVQFRYDFESTPAGRRHLDWLHGQFAEFAPLIVEVRHRSWATPDSLDFFRKRGVTVANLDYPTGRDSFNLAVCVTAPVGYLRLHGRNREAWYSKTSSPAEPYNYDYSDAEIAELAERARRIAGEVRHLIIVANNHFRGKGLSTALRLKAVLSRRKVPVPPALAAAYPAVARIAATGGTIPAEGA